MMRIRRARVEDARGLAQLRWDLRASIQGVIEGEQSFIEHCATWMTARLQAAGRWGPGSPNRNAA